MYKIIKPIHLLYLTLLIEMKCTLLTYLVRCKPLYSLLIFSSYWLIFDLKRQQELNSYLFPSHWKHVNWWWCFCLDDFNMKMQKCDFSVFSAASCPACDVLCRKSLTYIWTVPLTFSNTFITIRRKKKGFAGAFCSWKL